MLQFLKDRVGNGLGATAGALCTPCGVDRDSAKRRSLWTAVFVPMNLVLQCGVLCGLLLASLRGCPNQANGMDCEGPCR